MGRSRRVGGSGWAGVAGSFIGLGGERRWGKSKKKPAKAPSSARKENDFRGYATWEQARAFGLTPPQWKSRCDRDVKAIEEEYALIKAQANKLKAELQLAEKARLSAYALVARIEDCDT